MDVKKDYNVKAYVDKLDCIKFIGRSKYEKADPYTIVWWNNLFKGMEEKFSLPAYKKRRILKQQYSVDTLDELEALGIDIQDEAFDRLDLVRQSSVVVDNSRQKKLDELGVFEPLKIVQEQKENHYLNFMKKRKKDAQIWRPPKKIEIDSLTLLDKADRITKDIATDFDEYLRSLGGKKNVNVDEETILELFALYSNLPAETSLYRNGKELIFVPKAIADAARKKRFSERNRIKREIRNDLNIKGKNTTPIAFGQSLPLKLRVTAKPADIREKWMGCYVIHDELVSMTKAFDDITELMSVRGFCKWLLYHNEIPRAKFLVEKNLFDYKVLSRKCISAYQILNDMENPDLQTFHHPTQSFEEYRTLVKQQQQKN